MEATRQELNVNLYKIIWKRGVGVQLDNGILVEVAITPLEV